MPRPCACCDHPNRVAIEAEIVAGRSLRNVARAHGLTPAALHRHARNHLPAALAVAAAGHLAATDAGTAPSPAPIFVPEIEPAEAPPENETSFTDAAPHVPRALDFGDAPADAPAPQGSPLASITAAPAPSQQPEATIAPSAAPDDLWGLVISLRDRGLAVLNRAELANDGKLTLAALRELRGMVETLSRLAPAHGAAGSTAALAQTDEWANLRGIIIGALADHPEARLAVATALAGAGALT